jgi:ribosomal protein L37AE/L43A
LDVGERPKCPYCETTNVRVDGPNWKCGKCGKNWRRNYIFPPRIFVRNPMAIDT